MSISSFKLKERKKTWKGFKKIFLVPQQSTHDCAIATAAMIAGVSYGEAWHRLAPPPMSPELMAGYHERETRFLSEKGWWASAQLVLKTVVSLDNMDAITDAEERFKKVVDKSQRVRVVLAFADGAKPDHTVIWDRDHKTVVFDPSRGVVPIDELFNPAGLQSYSGVLGFTAFSYQPGQPTLALIKAGDGMLPA